MKKIESIVLIGTGNLASSLLPSFVKSDINVLQLIGRNSKTTKELANLNDVPFNTEIELINKNADAYILCVQDNQIEKLAQQLGDILTDNQWIVHCSGVMHSTIIKHRLAGSFYPFNTFIKGIQTDISQTPILIDSSTKAFRKVLIELGSSISKKTIYIPDEKRAQLHLAAVLSHNFSNYLISRAENLLEKNEMDRALLQPLLEQMIRALQVQSAARNQTGPAIRGDVITIEKHLSMLSTSDLLNTYLDLSNKINPSVLDEMEN